MIKTVNRNRFEVFFSEDTYTLLKNYLYNYMLRKEAIENMLRHEALDRVLEAGCGISPIMTRANRVVYTDISETAVRSLKNSCQYGWYVVADCARLPFKQNSFSHAICSEVLEHISDDMAAIQELNRTLKPSGRLIVTFPHRGFYFSIDDRLVKHYRRYEMAEIKQKLSTGGFIPVKIQKILGPLEKLTMIVVVAGYLLLRKIKGTAPASGNIKKTKSNNSMNFLTTSFKWINKFYAKIAWLDAKIMPRFLTTVVLMKCVLHQNLKQ